jgi:hypothetical protein
MPTVGLQIRRAWRYRSEPDRIHFVVATHEGDNRHLFTQEASALGRVLDEALRAQGYEGPSEAHEDELVNAPEEV